jgi:hypothetical protein
MGKKKGGGGGPLQDSDLISVSITVGTAKALLAALTQSIPPNAAVANAVSLALVRAMSAASGKKTKGKGKGSPKGKSSPKAVLTTPPPKKSHVAAAP